MGLPRSLSGGACRAESPAAARVPDESPEHPASTPSAMKRGATVSAMPFQEELIPIASRVSRDQATRADARRSYHRHMSAATTMPQSPDSTTSLTKCACVSTRVPGYHLNGTARISAS